MANLKNVKKSNKNIIEITIDISELNTCGYNFLYIIHKTILGYDSGIRHQGIFNDIIDKKETINCEFKYDLSIKKKNRRTFIATLTNYKLDTLRIE